MRSELNAPINAIFTHSYSSWNPHYYYQCCNTSYTLKEEQTKAIKSFVSGNDVLVCLPTGFGKSIIYGCLPVVFDQLLYQLLSHVEL
jgi:ATP-dependent helicase YprA (DUF1998 family)